MDPLDARPEIARVLHMVYSAAVEYLERLQTLPANTPWPSFVRAALDERLPEEGVGTLPAISRLIEAGTAAATHSVGPRFYQFATGGVTPAALAADWLVSVLDQNVAGRISSDFGTSVENVTIQWLLELFGLPSAWGGALVASATFANFTGLSCARQWWGEQHGGNPARDGIAQLGVMPVLSSGYVHPTTRKALQMLGHGKNTVEVFARDTVGRVDLDAMRMRLRELAQPCIIIANAGEVNAGDFDPISALADLAGEFGSWLHADAAFGLFARLAPEMAPLLHDIERADSIGADAHKWLNVPHESGFCFVKEPVWLRRAFGMPGAPYIQDLSEPDAGFAALGPESSRRARAIPIWASLSAYGRNGYRSMVERHIRLAKDLARAISAEPGFEVLASVRVPIVCFRYQHQQGGTEGMDDLNRRLGRALNDDGRFAVGQTQYAGRPALRVALFNWGITEVEIREFVEVLRELSSQMQP